MVHKISNNIYEKISSLVHKEIGLKLSTQKKQMVNSRLAGRLREMNFATYEEYYHYLKKNPEEIKIIYNLLTTNVTKFFREDYHFKFLINEIIPQYINKQKRKRIRIWSAGCASGEEPYSIAIILKEKLSSDWEIKITATDINTEVLDIARTGIYTYRQVKNVPYGLLNTYFKLGKKENKGLFKVKRELKNIVNFQVLNLNSSSDYNFNNKFDIIFCRNVFIYFNQQTREKILKHFYNNLVKDGYLFLGHSESISNKGQWSSIYKTTYKKQNST